MDAQFKVLAFCEILDKSEKESIIQAFSSFYHDLTIKHQTKVELCMVDSTSNMKELDQFAWIFEIEKNLIKVPAENPNIVSKFFTQSSLLLQPTDTEGSQFIMKAQSLGLPVICNDTPENSVFIDQTNGIFLKSKSTKDQKVELIAKYLKMIYFDPEVIKILRKGALAQHEINLLKGKIREVEHK